MLSFQQACTMDDGNIEGISWENSHRINRGRFGQVHVVEYQGKCTACKVQPWTRVAIREIRFLLEIIVHPSIMP
jgi:hypothetical protein